MKNYKLREVFTPGGMPSVTYVDRKNLGIEKKLKDALSRGHSIITVSGPTKSGKTVLCRTVVGGDASIWIEGRRVKSLADFWSLLADELGVAETTSANKDSTRGHSNSLTSDVNVGMPGLVGAKGGGTTTSSNSKTSGLAKSLRSDIPSRCIKAALERKLTIVVDDFHFLDQPTQHRPRCQSPLLEFDVSTGASAISPLGGGESDFSILAEPDAVRLREAKC